MIKIKLGLLLIASLLLIWGCNDDASDIGSGVIPSGDNMNVGVVTVKPTFFSQYHPDSIQTDDLSSLMLGSFWHKDFGLVKADIVSQLRFDTIEFSNNSTWVVDSVSLIILQNDVFGDTTAISELKVFELNTPIDNYTNYYSNMDESELYSEDDLLGELRYKPGQLEDTVKVYTTSGDSSILKRISVPISKEYGQRIYEGFSTYGNDVEKFQQMFNGIYVKSTFGNKTLSLVNISTEDDEDYYTAIALHLKHYITVDSVVDFTQYYYINSECGRFSVLHHDFSGVDINTDKNDAVSPDLVKVRGGGALNLKMTLPNMRDSLDVWFDNDTNFIINKALMTIKLAENEYDFHRYAPPSTFEAKIDTIAGLTNWYDNISSEGYFGGTYNSDENIYQFNITKFVQDILKNPDYNWRDLILYNESNAFSPWMAMFYGKDSVKIDIYYTQY